MDRVTQLENAIKFASQNPTDPKSLQLKTAIQAGKYNTELEQIKTKNQPKPEVAPTVPVDGNLGDRTATEMQRGVETIKTGITKGAENIEKGNVVKGVLQSGFGATGGAIETALAPITATLKPVLEKLAPQGLFANFLDTKNNDGTVDTTLTDKFKALVAEHPDEAQIGANILNTVLTAIGLPEGDIANIIKGSIPKNIASTVKSDIAGIPNAVKETAGNIKTKFSPTTTSDEAVGQILQGKTTDIPAGKRVFEDIYPEGIPEKIKTGDLISEVDSKIKPLAKQVDEAYNNLPDKLPRRLQELYLPETTSSGKIVNTNYVQEALSNMKELYQKTGDNVAFVEIKDLITKAKKEGLTYKEVNDIARKYNIEFGDKAFSKVSGDPLTSVNAQKFENVRTGVKNTARQGLGGEEAKFLDSKLSDYYDTRKLLKKQLERVNAETQKTAKTGIIQKAVGKLIDIADTVTGSPLKTIAKKMGLKDTTMSAMEIEKRLPKALEIIKKGKGLKEAEIESKLMEIFDDANVVPPANRPKAVNIPDAPEGTLVNIGMKIGKTDKMISKAEIQTILKKYGVKVEKSKIADSGTEPTFIAKLSKSLTDEEMYNLSKDLQQEAIPQLVNGVGKNHGAKNMDWGDFNPEYFMDLTGKTLK